MASTLINLATAYSVLGDVKMKKSLLERALVIKERHFGPDHPEMATVLTNLGSACGDVGDHTRRRVLLERKRLLRPRGLTTDGERQIYEHMRSHQLYEIPVGTLDAEFFIRIQGQLDLLVGPAKSASEPVAAGV